MAVNTTSLTRRQVAKFYPHVVVRWLCWLTLLVGLVQSVLIAPALAALTPSPVTVDSQVKVKVSLFKFNRRSNTYDGQAEITNRSLIPINTPIRLVISNIQPSSVSLANPSGLQGDLPYIDVKVLNGVLAPAAEADDIQLKFNNPQKVKFTFNTSVMGVIPHANHPPIANAGPDQTALAAGQQLTLDGSASSDEDGDPLTYHWSLLKEPAPNTGILDTLTNGTIKPLLTVTRKGNYQLGLIVNDGIVDSTQDTVAITTNNSKPVAVAGPAQTVKVNATAVLDGIASSDFDHDPLTYHWQLFAKPDTSLATLSAIDPLNPSKISLTPDTPGSYTLKLIVNDGEVDSDADSVIVSTENSAPVANAGPDQAIANINLPVTLDGKDSFDVDGDPLTYIWSLLHQPIGSQATINQIDQTKSTATFTPDKAGDYVGQLIVNDTHVNTDKADTVFITVTVPPPVNNPPVFTSSPSLTATVGSLYTYDANATDLDNNTLTYSLSVFPTGMTIAPDTGLINWTPAANQTGDQSVTVLVSDGQATVSQNFPTITVTPATTGLISIPDLSPFSRKDAEAAIINANLLVGTIDFARSATVPSGQVISQTPLVTDPPVAIGTRINLLISTGPDNGLPVDPAVVAPKIDLTVATTVSAATEFLYTGTNPIQTGVAPETIDAKRVAVIRGRVLDKQNNPLSGVTITVNQHPEFGQTASRGDGQFDMVVNGGGLLTVNYGKSGYLNAQRQVTTGWQDYKVLDDVVLIVKDAFVTSIDLTAATPMQIAQGTSQTDANGTRQATVLIPQGTQAQIFQPDGTTVPVTNLNLRLTEYTVGDNGPKAMPGPLPPTSGYTYAVEIGADEANVSVAGKEVLFNQPVFFYVDNFLGFPVGTQVPVGYYDKDKSAWIPANDGRIVKIISITGGLADLDTDGDGIVDNNPALGITSAERTQLVTTYSVGKSLQRVPVDHFSTYDLNYGISPIAGATAPNQAESLKNELDKCTTCKHSIIEVENQTLGETLSITGTPFNLNYRSNRVLGRAANTLQIPLSSSIVPSSLQHIDLELRIAGRVITQSFSATPNQNYTFTWDGLDSYGRNVLGVQSVQVRIGYAYPGFYNLPPNIAASFGAASGQLITGNIPSRQPAVIWQEYTTSIGQDDARKTAQAGWSFSVQHRYDPVSRILYQGDGGQRSILGSLTPDIITTVAGNGVFGGFNGTGGLATKASLNQPFDLALNIDGSLYIAESGIIRRVGQDGIITIVAGTGSIGFRGDGGPAIQALLGNTLAVTFGKDGNLYIADRDNGRIRRVDQGGIITTVAGNGIRGFNGDGGPATQASFNNPVATEVGSDGSLYISDSGNNRIRRVGLDGIITTVAGNGNFGGLGDGGPAIQASFGNPKGLALGTDGSLYIAATANSGGNNAIRRVGTDGIITTVAGNGILGFSGDGGPATQASLRVDNIAIAADGSLYVSDSLHNRIRHIDQNGIINTIAGNGIGKFSGDGGAATQASLRTPLGIGFGKDGNLYIADNLNARIRRVASPFPGFSVGEIAIPSEDGSELYKFDPTGRHLATLNTLTGSTLLSFSYDTQGNLNQITDADGLITRIERDALNNPAAIVAPFGQRTTLKLDSNGYLSKLTNPAGESHAMTYTADGLLTSFKDPRGNSSTFTYDPLGRLMNDVNAITGGLALSRTELADGHSVAVTSTLNRVTAHAVRNLTTGDRERKHTQADSTISTMLEKTDASFVTTEADGTLTTLLQGPDPRFSMLAPIAQSLQTSTGGLTANMTSQSTAVLANPSNPLSLTTLTDTVTLNGLASTRVFDATTKTLTATSPAARQSKAVIDSVGRLIQAQTTGILPINNTYDLQGRPATIAQGTGVDERLVSFTYNSQGYLDTVTDPLGRQVKYEYDLAGRVTRQILPDTREILFTYDANGNLASLLPPGKPAHSFTYTPINQMASYEPPAVGAGTNSTLNSYNLDQQLTQVLRPDGLTIAYAYDTAGRPSIVTVPEGNYSYSYNPTTGKLASVTTPDGLGLNYTYTGALPTLTTWTGAVAGNVGMTYDNFFRVNTRSVNGANPFTYIYDNDDLLTAVGNTTLGINLTLTRNAQNGLLTGTTLGSLSDSYIYNGFGEVTSYLAKFTTSDLFKTDFTRDKLGRITQKIETVGGSTNTFDYSYDLAGRLTEVKLNGSVQSSYGYDDNGNRTQLNGLPIAIYDAQDRLLKYNNTTYDYTANGELKSKIEGTQTTSYNYDVLGNLRQVTLPSGTNIDYVIDGQGRRIGKKRNGILEQGFLHQDQLKPIAELDGNGAIVSRFVYAIGVNVPDFMIKGGATYRIIKDHLGSPRLVVDIASNTVVQSISYDVWGNVLSDSNPGFQPFGFAGGLYDQDTRLVRFGARDYDAGIGRWTVKDPIGYANEDGNLYVYSKNDSINYFDIDGNKVISDYWVSFTDSTPIKTLIEYYKKTGKWCKKNEQKIIEFAIKRLSPFAKSLINSKNFAENIGKEYTKLQNQTTNKNPYDLQADWQNLKYSFINIPIAVLNAAVDTWIVPVVNIVDPGALSHRNP